MDNQKETEHGTGQPPDLLGPTLALIRKLVERSGEVRPGMDPMEVVDLVLEQVAKMVTFAAIPVTPEQAIAFIGSEYEVREDAEQLDRVRFQLTVHDLLSAFRWWFNDDGLPVPSDGEIYEAVSRRADPAGHDAALAESLAVLGDCPVCGEGRLLQAHVCNHCETVVADAADLKANVLARKAVTVTEKDEWISLKKQKPPFGQLVLTYNATASSKHDVRWGVACRRRGGRFNDQDWLVEVPWEWAPIGTPTHWRPLPLVPGAGDPDQTSRTLFNASKEQPELYTCIGKGGSYEMIGVAYGAGTMRDKAVVVYRDAENGILFCRRPHDFDERMQKIGDQEGGEA